MFGTELITTRLRGFALIALPGELDDPRLSRTAERVLRRRGVEVLTGESVAKAGDGYVELKTGDEFVTRSLIWCVGVRADPLVDGLDLATNRGRLVVDEFMAVHGAPSIYACGDCAAVPDLTRPGQVCGMTAQHAERQGRLVARNVAASLGRGTARPLMSKGHAPDRVSTIRDEFQLRGDRPPPEQMDSSWR